MTVVEVRLPPRHAETCPGCLGDGDCWVCLGLGKLPHGTRTLRCHRCGGTGFCTQQP